MLTELHLFSRDAQDLEVYGAHDGQRQKIGSASDDEDVDAVQLKLAPVGLHPVLHRPVDGVPARVDRREADECREDPDAGVYLPDEPNADGVVVTERLTDSEVSIETDGKQDEER